VSPDNRRQNLAAELERGRSSLRAAELCLQAGLFDDAVSRAYYGAFHHVQALLLTEGLEARTHAGTHDLLFVHFVRPGLLAPAVAKRFAALQKYREQADYARAFRFDLGGAQEELAAARQVCDAISEFLSARGWLTDR
jgi:uncharacterized protein (UPF0332 family)